MTMNRASGVDSDTRMTDDLDYDYDPSLTNTTTTSNLQQQQQQPLQPHEVQIVTPGEVIVDDASNVLCGHGAYRNIDTNELIASVCGIVERVNKLISVRPLRARYNGEVGDVVVGRITEISGKKWRVDIQAKQDAILLLSSVNLPGGIQRRKTQEDALNMRSLYAENDLIVAEVHSPFQDGTLSLQTRSSRYGKLENGIFVRVHAALVKRCTQHFHTFSFGVQAILGNNGYIWLTKARESNKHQQHVAFMSVSKSEQESESNVEISGKDRENICRVRNAILALETQFLPIYPQTIMEVYDSSLKMDVKDMMIPDNIRLITTLTAERIATQFASSSSSSDTSSH